MLTKRKRRVIIIAAAVLCIAAAVITAVVLQKQNSNKGLSEYATTSYKDIVENSSLPVGKYENLDLSGAVLTVPETEKFYQYYELGLDRQFYTPLETAKLARELYKEVFDYVDTENAVFGYTDAACTPWTDEQAYDPVFHESFFYVSYPGKYEYRDGAGMHRGFTNVGESGTFLVNYLVERVIDTESELIETINLDRGEQLQDKAYVLDGREYKMSDALEYAGETLKRIKKYLPDAELKPTKFCVFLNHETEIDVFPGETPMGDYYSYSIEYEFVLDGIPLTDTRIRNFNLLKSFFNVGVCQLRLEIDSPDRVGYIMYAGPCAVVGREKEPLEDKFISLDNACKLLSDYMAPYYVQHVDEVTVKYASTWDATISYSGTDEKLYYKPYWCFIMDEVYDPYTSHFISGRQMLVDMQTGDIFIVVDNTYVSTLEAKNDKTAVERRLEEMEAAEGGE